MRMKKTNNGSALLTVLGIVAVVSIIIGMLHLTASQQTKSTVKTSDMLKARTVAESALNLAYNEVRNDFEKVKVYQSSGSTANGKYEVSSKSFDGTYVNRAQLTAKGTSGEGQVTVSVDLENVPLIKTNEDSTDEYYALEHDIMVGGAMQITGAFHSDVTSIHVNGDATINKQSNVTDPVTITSSGTVTWGSNVKQIPDGVVLQSNVASENVFPEDLQAVVQKFIDFAKNNGQVYDSDTPLPSTPEGGVMIYTGPESLHLDGTYNGTIIVLGGQVNVNANAVLNGPNGYPSLISLSPDNIIVNGGSVFNGAVLALNSEMTFNGESAIYGPILTGQNLKANGTADLYAGGGQGFSLPPEQTSLDKVVITAWH